MAAENLHIPRILARVFSPPPGMDFEEWQSEVFLVFLDAVRRHDPARGTLGTLADRIVKRRRSYLEAQRRVKKYGRTRRHTLFCEFKHSPATSAGSPNLDEIEKVVGLTNALPDRPRKAIWSRCQGKSFAGIGKLIGTSEAGAFRLVRRTIDQLRLAAVEPPRSRQSVGAGRAAR